MARATRDWDAIKRANEARMATIPLRDARPSTTRSDALSGPLHAAGLGIDALVVKLKAMLSAKTTRYQYTKVGLHEFKRDEITVDDTKTQLEAVKLLKEIHGYSYAPQKSQDQDPLVVIINQLPEETRIKLLSTIQNRLLPLTSGDHAN